MTEDDADDMQMPAPSTPENVHSLFADSASERTRFSEAVRSHSNSEPVVMQPTTERPEWTRHAYPADRNKPSRSPMPIIALFVALLLLVSLVVFLAIHKNTAHTISEPEELAKTEPASTANTPPKPTEAKADSPSTPAATSTDSKTPGGKPNEAQGPAVSGGTGLNPTGTPQKEGSGSPASPPNTGTGKIRSDAQANPGGATGGKSNSKQGPGGNNEGGGDIPLGDNPGDKIMFEGRWIEKAVRQKRTAQLSQRAFAEAEAHYKSKTTENTRIAPFNSPLTIVTALKSDESFLVIGKYQEPGKSAVPFMCEVQRIGDGKWRIVHAQ
ncbi:MAG: hypothetical protein WCT04_22950 [Planctomycetota bacterium]